MKLRVLAAGAAMVAALPGVVIFWAAPASGAETEQGLSYSLDGQAYSDVPPPVFEGIPALVPGDESTRYLWIRNDRESDIEVRIRPVEPEASTRIYFETAGASVVRLEPDQAAEIGLQVGLPWSSGNGPQGQQVPSLQVRIDAVEVADSDGPAPDPSQPPRDEEPPDGDEPREESPQSDPRERHDDLADTGSNGASLLAAAGIVGLAGLVLLAVRRKNQNELEADGVER